MSSSAPRFSRSMYVMRLASWVRALRSSASAGTFLAIAPGEKSDRLSNVTSTLRLPSPVSLFGTCMATRGFIALRRSSKLSTEISTNLRSVTAAAARPDCPRGHP